jgi:hypothetical protein
MSPREPQSAPRSRRRRFSEVGVPMTKYRLQHPAATMSTGMLAHRTQRAMHADTLHLPGCVQPGLPRRLGVAESNPGCGNSHLTQLTLEPSLDEWRCSGHTVDVTNSSSCCASPLRNCASRPLTCACWPEINTCRPCPTTALDEGLSGDRIDRAGDGASLPAAALGWPSAWSGLWCCREDRSR